MCTDGVYHLLIESTGKGPVVHKKSRVTTTGVYYLARGRPGSKIACNLLSHRWHVRHRTLSTVVTPAGASLTMYREIRPYANSIWDDNNNNNCCNKYALARAEFIDDARVENIISDLEGVWTSRRNNFDFDFCFFS